MQARQDSALPRFPTRGKTMRPANTSLLPVEAYTSPHWFEREQQELFAQTWQFVGMREEWSQAGHYACVDVGRAPLVIVADADGTLRAFHNICRHRGTQLLSGSGQLDSGIRCPYHSWLYSLSGVLQGLPQPDLFPDIQKTQLGLLPAAVETWKGMVFVHTDPQAVPLASWFAGLEERLSPHKPQELREAAVHRYIIRANWKVFVENYLDGYHLRYLHRHSASEYDHGRQDGRFVGLHWTFYQPLSAHGQQKAPAWNAYVPRIPDYPEHVSGAFAPMLFPNIGILATEHFWTTVHVQPVAPDHTLIELRTRLVPDVVGAKEVRTVYNAFAQSQDKPQAGRFDEGAAAQPESLLHSEDIMLEDIHVCQMTQRAMRSPAFGVGAYAKYYEDALPQYQRHILSYVPVRKEAQVAA